MPKPELTFLNADGSIHEITPHNPHPDKKKQELDFNEASEVIIKARTVAQKFEIGQKEATFVPEIQDRPIVVSLMTDVHYGSMRADTNGLRRDLDTIQNTEGMYVVTNGDDVDNFNATGKWASGMMEDPLPPQIQSRAVMQRMKELDREGKIGAMGFGNHNDFAASAGQDWYESFSGDMECPIFTQGGELTIEVGDQEYKLAMAHKYWGTSKLNPTNAVKRFIDFEHPDADIGFLGHTHQSEGLMYEKGGKERVAVIGGTYKDEDAFAAKHGIGGRAGSPGWCVGLDNKKKHMTLFKRLEDGVKFLKGGK